jgi:hypothetical protein
MRNSTRKKTALALAPALACTAAIAGVLAGSGSASPRAATPPTLVAQPHIVGLQVGQTLRVGTGTWSGTTPMSFLYTWQRGDGVHFTPIAGVGGPTYTITKADIGKHLLVQVKATNSAGWAWANTVSTSEVTGPTAGGSTTLPDGTVVVPVAQVSLPDRLVIGTPTFSPGTLSPTGSTTMTVRVSDALGNAVSGALVQVTALPFGTVQPPVETPTDGSGNATVSLTGRAPLAHSPGNAIALSIRARKPGDNVLTGVTAERLVKLDVSH